MATSIVRRVATGSALAASAAALVAALATTLLSSMLLQSAEDRRLEEAAVTFARELDERHRTLDEVYRDESEEMDHTGMLFAVYDAERNLLVGNRHVGLPATSDCTSNAYALRVCRAPTSRGLYAVVGSAHVSALPLLSGAAIAAALFAALLAWIVSRPISRYVVAPLTRLRERIAHLEVDAIGPVDLGPEEQVAEVDALRSGLGQLISRVERALAHAHRFAANAAHELRTPLAAVHAELELLAESITETEARESVRRAEAKLTELTVLVDRLLILSVPARATNDAHELVSLRDLLEDAVATLPADERARVQLSDDDAIVRGDATLLGTMIGNAIANALKLGAQVTTTLSRTDDIAVLHIDDDGPGMEEAVREHVFEPFFRTAHALQQRVPGHGLGLALIRHIAQTHGGTTAFVDKPTRGARLEIRLPLAPRSRVERSRVPLLASIALFLLCMPTLASAQSTAPPAEPPRLRVHLPVDLSLTLGGGAAWIALEVLKPTLAPASCAWCPSAGYDVTVRDTLRWTDPAPADVTSYVTGFALAPIAALGLDALAVQGRGGSAREWFDDALVISESIVIASDINQIVKFAVGRERPFVHALPAHEKPNTSQPSDNNVSFFSGHTTLAFAAAVSSGTIASLKGYRSAPYIWATGLALATTTGYLRIAADKHYLTDVLVGAACGAAVGALVPWIHRPTSDTRSTRVTGLTGAPVVGGAWVGVQGVLF